jgi:hypothetical protein
MVVLQWIRSVVDYLGPGQLIVGIALLFVAPLATRWVEKTNEVTVQVLYNSRMGLARLLREALSGVADAKNQEPIGAIIRSLDGLSQVILAIRNSGHTSIKDTEFSEKLSFDFTPRIIWNARVSEVPDSMNRSREDNESYIEEGLRFAPMQGSGRRRRSTWPSCGIAPGPGWVATTCRRCTWCGWSSFGWTRASSSSWRCCCLSPGTTPRRARPSKRMVICATAGCAGPSGPGGSPCPE